MNTRFVDGVMYLTKLVPLAAASVAAPSLFGQDATNDSSQAYYVTNRPAWFEPDNKSLTLSYGAFDLHPRLRTTEIYDDNILFASKYQERDFITQVAPGIQILGGDRQTLENYVHEYQDWNLNFNLVKLNPSWLVIQPAETWPDKFLLLDYSPQWQEFSHYTSNDSLDQFLTVNGVWPMAKLVIGFQETYSDQKTTIIEANTRAEVEQNLSELDAGYRLNDKFSIDTTFDSQSVSYPGSTNLTGYTEWKGSVSINRQVNELLNVSLVGAGGDDVVQTGADQQFAQAGFRARYSYSQIFSVDGSLGGEYRKFDSGIASTVTPYFTFGANYQPWERFFLRAGVERQQFASIYDNYYYTATGGYVTMRRNFTDRFYLQGDLNYWVTDYTSNAKVVSPNTLASSIDYYSLRLTADLKVWKHFDAQCYYQFSGSGLSQNQSVLQDNQTGLQLELRF